VSPFKGVAAVELTLPFPGPFCILGLRYLQQAIATAQSSDPSSPLAHLDFELEFKPFLLDPTLTREPIDKREKYEARFGKEKFAQMEVMMQQRAKACGLDL
jgi:predicted DsbA family dithiol-disulfide isomerase